MDPELVITHFTIPSVTSKQQKSCHRNTYHADVAQSHVSRITEATHCFSQSLIQLITLGLKTDLKENALTQEYAFFFRKSQINFFLQALLELRE